MNEAALSSDVWRLIFQRLSVQDLGQCHAVCRSWNHILTTAVAEGDPETSIWRLKLEERWWSPTPSTADSSNYRQIFRNKVLHQREMARYLREGNCVDNCDLKPWLLCGHNKQVLFVCCMGDDFIVTMAADGEVRSWELPFTTNRPNSKLVLTSEEVGKIERAATLSDDLFVVSSGFTKITLLWIGLSSDTTADQIAVVKGRLLQSICTNKRTISALAANQNIVFAALGDYTIQAMPLIRTDKDSEILQTNPNKLVIMQGHASTISSIHMGSKQGTILSCSADQTVCIWDYTNGVCLRTVTCREAVGRYSLLGSSRYEFVMLWDTLEETRLTVHSLNDGREIRRLQNTASRFQSANLYENFALCGTADGTLVEYNLNDGQCTCEGNNLLGSAVESACYLGGRNYAYVFGYEGELLFLKRQTNQDSLDTWTVVRTIDLKLRGARYLAYDAPTRTILIPSSGWLVRALVFHPFLDDETILP